MARKNDLAFTAGHKVLVIGEHQSTLNLNMPLRSAIYYGRTMERLIPPKDIYKVQKILIPTPEFYVFYNGTLKQPAERILKLSDLYLEKTKSPMLELKWKTVLRQAFYWILFNLMDRRCETCFSPNSIWKMHYKSAARKNMKKAEKPV